MSARLPAAFISHGSPMAAVEKDEYRDALRRFGARFSSLDAIVVVSAHWQAPWPLRVTAWKNAPLIYDFGGFPEELYRIRYAAPGHPALAREIARMLNATEETERGLDHGAWVPLSLAFPEAAVPVVQVSLPEPATPQQIFEIGRTLRTLRERNVLLLGSGGIVHNLRRVRLHDKNAPIDAWAKDFDDAVAAHAAAKDLDALSTDHKNPFAVPTSEHFDPIFFALGAAYEADVVETIHEGFQYANLSMRCFYYDKSADYEGIARHFGTGVWEGSLSEMRRDRAPERGD